MKVWTYVPCPNERYALEPGVRLRPVPEMGVCLAYTPARPCLHRLNAASWLIVSRCDGRRLDQIAAECRAWFGGGVQEAEMALHHGLEQLLSLGIIRRLPAKPERELSTCNQASEERKI
jgi:hypothetical protein